MQTPEEKKQKAREATRKWRENNPERARESARKTQKKWRDENTELHRARAKAFRDKDPVAFKETQKVYRANNREKMRRMVRKQYYRLKYGITIEERDQMLADQGGVCKICGTDDPNSPKGWHVDHCHDKGYVRGILCMPCNTTLGRVDDNIYTLRAMISYLETDHTCP